MFPIIIATLAGANQALVWLARRCCIRQNSAAQAYSAVSVMATRPHCGRHELSAQVVEQRQPGHPQVGTAGMPAGRSAAGSGR